MVLTAAVLVPHGVLAQQRGAAATPAPAPAAASGTGAGASHGRRQAGSVRRLVDGRRCRRAGLRRRTRAWGRRRGPAGAPPATITSLYKPEVAASNKKLGDNDDPTLKCVPTAFGTLNVSLFDVGAVGQIVATPRFIVMLTETFHGWRVVPTDGRPHREEVPPSFRGDSVGRWDGDVFVMETKNFTDDTWIWAEGRVSPHSDQLRIVERYRRVNANTLEIEATIHDPKMLTAPWDVPKQTLTLAPFDQIMPLVCLGQQ